MNDNIFGYSWEDIKRAQQGGQLSRPVGPSSPVSWTDADEKLLGQYPTFDLMLSAGFHGTADRGSRLGKFTRRASGKQGG